LLDLLQQTRDLLRQFYDQLLELLNPRILCDDLGVKLGDPGVARVQQLT
jgi:hypothetical protein